MWPWSYDSWIYNYRSVSIITKVVDIEYCITETTSIPTIYDEENLIKERCITETTPIPTNYDEENLIKEYCITETTPIPTIYDEENVVKERCITETTSIPTIYDEENVIKERCITETIPIPTNYDEENVIKERCITETTPIPTIYDKERTKLRRYMHIKHKSINQSIKDLCDRDRMIVGFTTTDQCLSSLKLLTSNPAIGEVDSIQHYVI